MQRCSPIQVESRPQLVPNPGSPLSLETWCMADLESWLCDSSTLLRPPSYPPQPTPKTSPYHSNVHVSIPSPSAPMAAESPTLYDSPPGKGYVGPPSAGQPMANESPTLYENTPGKGYGGQPMTSESPTLYDSVSGKGYGGQPMASERPPPYVHVKQEVEDDYTCVATGRPGMPLPAVVKREEEEGCLMTSETMEQLRNLAVEQAAKDIHVACGILGIRADPALWTVEEAKSWLSWTASQYGLSTEALRHFFMDGLTLSGLTEAYFRQKLPGGGDILYAQLEIWKTAASLQRQTSHQQQQQQVLAFRPEDSMLDMSGILDQWSSFQRHSPPSRSPLLQPDSCNSSVASPGGSHDFSSEGMQSDDEISDEACDPERCSSSGSSPSHRRPGSHSHIHLWQFLKELLCQPHLYGSCIRWLDRPKGIFKIEDSVRVARLWGKRKNRPAMNYDKLSRSIRQYYKKGIMKKTERSQRLVYQFCHPYAL